VKNSIRRRARLSSSAAAFVICRERAKFNLAPSQLVIKSVTSHAAKDRHEDSLLSTLFGTVRQTGAEQNFCRARAVQTLSPSIIRGLRRE
jgi:hypothetical protein